MNKNILQSIKSIIDFLILLFIIMVSIFSEFFSDFIQLKSEHLIIIFAGILISILLQQLSMQNFLARKIEENNQIISIQENSSMAYSNLFKKHKIIKNLRIYAISSREVQANIAAISSIKIENCTLLVRNLHQGHYLYTEQQKSELQMNLERWKMMVKNGIIERLRVVSYDDISNDYCVIVDNKAMLGDIFYLDGIDTSGQNNFSPILVKSNTITGRKIIERYIYRFDNYVNRLEELNQSNVLLDCTRSDF